MKTTLIGLLAIVAATLSAGSMAVTEPVPDGGAKFAGAPEPMRQFFVKARAADMIADPLERCLAFPDAPGNAWPAGLARLYCEGMYGPRLRQAQIKALLDQGAYVKLEQEYRSALDQHASQQSELIHAHFVAFDESPEGEALSRRWLAKAPKSPFANMAMGKHLAEKAVQVRGHEYASKTPAAKMRAMRALSAKSLSYLEKAIRLEPALIPAYVSMLSLGSMNGSEELEQRAFSKANSLDPGCWYLAFVRMHALQPRWGGSQEAMDAYARELAALVPKRPLLAIPIAAAGEEAAYALSSQRRLREAIALRERVARSVPHPTVFEHLGKDQTRQINGRNAAALANFLTAYRFGSGHSLETHSFLGHQLALFGDREWAHKVLKLAVKDLHGDTSYRSFIARSYMAMERYDDAIPLLAEALKRDQEGRGAILSDLVDASLATGKLVQAEQYARTWTRETPNMLIAWLMSVSVAKKFNDPAKVKEVWARYLKEADRSDPAIAHEVSRAERAVRGEAEPAESD